MNEMLQKVISTSSIGADPSRGNGFLNQQQSGRFIDYMWDATVMGSLVRKERMNGDTAELDRLSIGERLVRLATEAVDDGVNPVVAFTKVSLRAEKFRMDWELSSDALEEGLEGDALEDRIARLMAQQAANDLEDLAINGDSTNQSGDALLKGFDGWRKRLYYGGTVLDAGSVTLPDGTSDNTLHRGIFSAALRAMPRKFNNTRGSLRFLTATGLIQDFLYRDQFVESLQGGYATGQGARPGSINDNPPAVAGWTPVSPFGVPLTEVPYFPEYDVDFNGASSGLGTPGAGQTGGRGSDLWLVEPRNLIWGVRREVQVYREFKPKKDTIEYTMYTKVAANVENPQATVVVKNVAYRN